MAQRSAKEWLGLVLKGMAMGAADVVPGVSGGTVAFITGIYQELLKTIGGLGLSTVQTLLKDGPLAAWRKANFGFLAALLVGILCSVLSLAGALHHLLEHEPVLLWAFFFGLVAASVPFMLAEFPRAQGRSAAAIALVLGAAFAWWITGLPPLIQGDSHLFLLLSGAVAICAMILPGISGSFILVLLGAYSAVIGALKGLDVGRVFAFAGGAVVGQLSFSKALGWAFEKHRPIAMALLSGFLIGSLRKLWPWKENVKALFVHSDGRVEYLQQNVSPLTHPDAELVPALVCALIGALAVGLLGRWGRSHATTT